VHTLNGCECTHIDVVKRAEAARKLAKSKKVKRGDLEEEEEDEVEEEADAEVEAMLAGELHLYHILTNIYTYIYIYKYANIYT